MCKHKSLISLIYILTILALLLVGILGCDIVTLSPVEAQPTVMMDTQEQATITPVNSYPLLVNINTSSLEDLMTLPGIGEVLSQRIVDARPFDTIEDLLTVKGIGPKTYQGMYPYICTK